MYTLVLREALDPVAGQAGPPTGGGNIDTAPCSLAVHQPGVGGAAAAVARAELVQARVGFLAECHPVLLAAVLFNTAVSSTGGSVLPAGLGEGYAGVLAQPLSICAGGLVVVTPLLATVLGVLGVADICPGTQLRKTRLRFLSFKFTWCEIFLKSLMKKI